jgi:sialic acid synthase SpsE
MNVIPMKIDNPQEPYIIGEVAHNHEGDVDYMRRMIDDIAEMKLDAIKFHLLLKPESYFQGKHPMIKIRSEWVFSESLWSELIQISNEKGLEVIALCDDVESIEFINRDSVNVAAVELHSTGLNDWYLHQEAAKFKGTVILGVGGTTLDEIENAIESLQLNGKKDLLLMHGFQNYPTDYAEINLSKMIKIRDLFGLPMGYADHTAYDDPYNEYISSLGAVLGIHILEKHYTPDYGKERIDYHSAVGMEHIIKTREMMRVALKVRGDGSLKLSKAELEYGNTGPMKKAVVARKKIKKGEELTLDNLWFKRTKEQSTINQTQFLKLIGLKAKVDIEEDEIVDFTKVEYEFQAGDAKDFHNVNTLD